MSSPIESGLTSSNGAAVTGCPISITGVAGAVALAGAVVVAVGTAVVGAGGVADCVVGAAINDGASASGASFAVVSGVAAGVVLETKLAGLSADCAQVTIGAIIIAKHTTADHAHIVELARNPVIGNCLFNFLNRWCDLRTGEPDQTTDQDNNRRQSGNARETVS